MTVSLAQGGGNEAGNGNNGATGSENAGNNGSEGAAAVNGSQQQTQQQTTNNGDWLASLSGENKTLAEQKGWKSQDDVLKSYGELQKAFSGRGTKASTFKLSDYAFNAPTDEAAKKSYSPEGAEALKQFSQQNGIEPETASKLHDFYVGYMQKQGQAAATKAGETLASNMDAAGKALEKSWGVDTSPSFKRNAELAFRTVRELGWTDALVEIGALHRNGDGRLDVVNATIAEGLAKIGAQMYAEDSLFGASAADANPFAVGTPHENATKAGEILRTDPDKAEVLIRAAGPEVVAMYQYWLDSRVKK